MITVRYEEVMKRSALLAAIIGSAALLRAQRAEAALSLGSLALATGWLGGHPTLASLRGRVVLVDVFTFECINCTNITPALKHLYASYPRSDLAIVAVHTRRCRATRRACATWRERHKSRHCPGRLRSTTSIASGTRTTSRRGRRSSSSTEPDSLSTPS